MIDNKTIRQVVINKALLPCTPGAEVTREASGSGSSDRAVFSCNLIKPLESLIFTLEPQQEGSGDPSPDNPRPISGESEIKFFTRYGDPSSYTIPLTVTVYGGYVNEKGEVWSNVKKIDNAKNLGWTATNKAGIFYCTIADKLAGYTNRAWCSEYGYYQAYFSGMGNYQMASNSTYNYLYIKNTDCSTVDELKEELDGVAIYYTATPVKIATIDPIVINTNKGTNEMWTRGDIPFTLEYKYMEDGSCEISKQFLPIFYPNGKGVNHNGSTF